MIAYFSTRHYVTHLPGTNLIYCLTWLWTMLLLVYLDDLTLCTCILINSLISYFTTFYSCYLDSVINAEYVLLFIVWSSSYQTFCKFLFRVISINFCRCLMSLWIKNKKCFQFSVKLINLSTNNYFKDLLKDCTLDLSRRMLKWLFLQQSASLISL